MTRECDARGDILNNGRRSGPGQALWLVAIILVLLTRPIERSVSLQARGGGSVRNARGIRRDSSKSDRTKHARQGDRKPSQRAEKMSQMKKSRSGKLQQKQQKREETSPKGKGGRKRGGESKRRESAGLTDEKRKKKLFEEAMEEALGYIQKVKEAKDANPVNLTRTKKPDFPSFVPSDDDEDEDFFANADNADFSDYEKRMSVRKKAKATSLPSQADIDAKRKALREEIEATMDKHVREMNMNFSRRPERNPDGLTNFERRLKEACTFNPFLVKAIAHTATRMERLWREAADEQINQTFKAWDKWKTSSKTFENNLLRKVLSFEHRDSNASTRGLNKEEDRAFFKELLQQAEDSQICFRAFNASYSNLSDEIDTSSGADILNSLSDLRNWADIDNFTGPCPHTNPPCSDICPPLDLRGITNLTEAEKLEDWWIENMERNIDKPDEYDVTPKILRKLAKMRQSIPDYVPQDDDLRKAFRYLADKFYEQVGLLQGQGVELDPELLVALNMFDRRMRGLPAANFTEKTSDRLGIEKRIDEEQVDAFQAMLNPEDAIDMLKDAFGSHLS